MLCNRFLEIELLSGAVERPGLAVAVGSGRGEHRTDLSELSERVRHSSGVR